MTSTRRRAVCDGIVDKAQCEELIFVQTSCSAVGYRPWVQSTTLHQLVATDMASLLVPFLPVRETIRDLVEESFGCECELSIEFTGLVSWGPGAAIGWHSDSNRPYLKQRHFAVRTFWRERPLAGRRLSVT